MRRVAWSAGPAAGSAGPAARQAVRTLASSSDPRKNSEPGRAPITRAALFQIEPTAPALEKLCPSTTRLIEAAVLAPWTVCQAPSFSPGPAMSSFEPADPTNPQEAWPVGWYSTLNSPPTVVKRPLRMRSQSGVAGTLVVFRWIVTVRSAAPGLSAAAVGTDTKPEPLKPNAVPANPGAPTVTPLSVPSWPPTASCMTVPEVSSMCHSATWPGAGGAGTRLVAAEVAVAEPAELDAVTATRSVRPASGAATT